MERLSKSDVVDAIAKATGLSKKDTDAVVSEFTTVLEDALKQGKEVLIHKLGAFKVTQRQARVGRNPKTGEEIKIPATKVAKFVPAKSLKEQITK